MSDEHEPTLEDVIGEILDTRSAELRVALPGKVVRYDAAAQVADIQPQLRDVFLGSDGEFVDRSFPVLPRVPVQFMRGGGFFVIVPIAVGDTGLLVFNDLPLDRWRATGQQSHPGDVRRHSLTSAVFIPGLVPTASALSEASANADLVLGKAGGLAARITAGNLMQVGGGSDFVALAALVKARLDTIQAAFDSHIHVTTATLGLAGVATIARTAAPIGPLQPVAATKLKTD